MTYNLVSRDLSRYQNFILNNIIDNFETSACFNIYNLVEKAVADKCILPSQNALVMNTYYVIKEQLIAYGLIIEVEGMIAYRLTEKGKILKACRTIQEYDRRVIKKEKWTMLHNFFHFVKQEMQTKEVTISQYE